MSTKIEWADETWNPVTGCTKKSPGCKNCYAERLWRRLQKLIPAYAKRDFSDVQSHQDRLAKPLGMKAPRRIFVNSMSDLFHPEVPFEFIDKVFAVMAIAKQHTFPVLTKRPERMLEYFNSFNGPSAGVRGFNICAWADEQFGIDEHQFRAITSIPKGLPNVWLGVSVENQDAADERIPLLLETPAAIRWISAGPLLGPIHLNACWMKTGCGLGDDSDRAISKCYQCTGPCAWPSSKIDWIVAEGETGPKARPTHPDWVRSLRNQCAGVKVPFNLKQWGEWAPADAISDDDDRKLKAHWLSICGKTIDPSNGVDFFNGDDVVYRAGKRAAGRLLDGVMHDEYPTCLAEGDA